MLVLVVVVVVSLDLQFHLMSTLWRTVVWLAGRGLDV